MISPTTKGLLKGLIWIHIALAVICFAQGLVSGGLWGLFLALLIWAVMTGWSRGEGEK